MQPVRGIEGTRPPAGGKKEPSGLFFSAPGCGSQHPRVPWAARAFCWPLPQQLLPASATGRGRRCCKSHPVGMSNVVAAAAFARGIFNLTRTGIAAELTAASEQRLPPVGGRCRIATKRGVQGSEAGAVVSGMRTPLQGVKHTLGTTTRDRAAVRSTATKAPVGCCLVPRVAAPSIRACLGRLAFLRIVSCAERIRVGEADNPKAAGSNPKSWRFPPVRREDLLTAF